jgi:hypothetical protein
MTIPVTARAVLGRVLGEIPPPGNLVGGPDVAVTPAVRPEDRARPHAPHELTPEGFMRPQRGHLIMGDGDAMVLQSDRTGRLVSYHSIYDPVEERRLVLEEIRSCDKA